MRQRLFGTDGIRTRAGVAPLDYSTLFRLGQAIVIQGRRNILIGRDTRGSGPWIENVLAGAIELAGGEVRRSGVLTTPGIAYLTRRFGFEAGIVISASHNPYYDNGIKIFSKSGRKLSDADEDELEDLMRKLPALPSSERDAAGDELLFTNPKWSEPYCEFLSQTQPPWALAGLEVVLDGAHGAAYRIAAQLFESLGAEVYQLAVQPDGTNINRHCGALHPENICQAVASRGAALGVAFDGDADRVILADEEGNLVDGDDVLYILARHLSARGELASRRVVTTVMANLGLEDALSREDIQLVRTRVGDRYVLEAMLKGGHDLGGEQSGHIILKRYSVAGDGILVALEVSRLVKEAGALSELRRGFTKYPQVLLNVPVREKRDLGQDPSLRQMVAESERRLGSRGRVLVRYSGTEPLARVMVEGVDEAAIRFEAELIASELEKKLGLSGAAEA